MQRTFIFNYGEIGSTRFQQDFNDLMYNWENTMPWDLDYFLEK